MKRNLFLSGLTALLLTWLILMGLPQPRGPLTALRISSSGTTSRLAWSASGERLARANDGNIFVYDLAKYIYQDPRVTKPVLIESIVAPGVASLQFSPEGRSLLVEVETFDLANPFLVLDLDTEELLTLEADTKNVLLSLFWLDSRTLGAFPSVAPLVGKDRLVTIDLEDQRRNAADKVGKGLLGGDILFLPVVSDRVVRGHNLRKRVESSWETVGQLDGGLLLGLVRDPNKATARLLAIDIERARGHVLADDLLDISVAANGRAVAWVENIRFPVLATVTADSVEFGQLLVFEDHLGRTLYPDKLSLSRNGKFLAFDNAAPEVTGVFVAPIP